MNQNIVDISFNHPGGVQMNTKALLLTVTSSLEKAK